MYAIRSRHLMFVKALEHSFSTISTAVPKPIKALTPSQETRVSKRFGGEVYVILKKASSGDYCSRCQEALAQVEKNHLSGEVNFVDFGDAASRPFILDLFKQVQAYGGTPPKKAGSIILKQQNALGPHLQVHESVDSLLKAHPESQNPVKMPLKSGLAHLLV